MIVSTHRTLPGKWITCAGLITAVCLTGGCHYGSLACGTGPSQAGMWSVAGVQDAHVGEELAFSFILRERFKRDRLALFGIADYAAVYILGDRIEAPAGIDHTFAFKYKLEGVEPGRTITATAEAFKIRGSRDYMKIRGRWQRSVSTVDDTDKQVARDSIKLRIYQSKVDFTVPASSTVLDWPTARMVITRRENKESKF